MRRKITLLLAVAALTMMVASGCALADLIVNNDTAPAPTPSFTPRPTFTPTTPVTIEPVVAPTFTPTATPDATPTPADTPTPEVPPTPEPTPTPEGARLVINNPTLNVRSGPGTNYGTIGQARNGERYDVTGKNAAGSWYQINFNGQTGWVAGQYVAIEGDANTIQVASNVPAPPVQPTRPPAPTPVPQPPPAPVEPPAPVAPPAPSFPWTYTGSAVGAPQCAGAFFRGQVQYANGSPQNGVCVLIDYYGPRTIKFSGSGGQGDGNWGFSPCVTAGSASACTGPYKMYVVECPAGVPDAGLSLEGSGGYAPQSNVFEANVTDACVLGEWSNIIFKGAQ